MPIFTYQSLSEVFYQDWIDQLMELDVFQVHEYCLRMTDGTNDAFWEFQKRNSLYYARNGDPIEDPEIPEAMKLDPMTEEGRKEITSECMKSKSVRTNLAKVDLHRLPPKAIIGFMTHSLIELM